MAERRSAIFVPSLVGGGAERVMVTLANALATRGYSVDLLLADKQGPYIEDVSTSVRIVDLRAGRVIKALWPLIRYLKKERPEVMLSAMGHANVVAILARMLSRSHTRVVVSEHNTVSEQDKGGRSVASWIISLLMRLLYGKTFGVCAVSKGAGDDLARVINFPRDRVKTIHNPFDLSSITSQAAETLEHAWFISGEPPVLLTVGRLSEQKDYSLLIHAFAKVRETHRARLLILGEGELRANLQRLARECGLSDDDVMMPGFVRNPYSYMARCASFVLSSRWEGLPTVLIEAMACGAPVVSTDCPSGPHEILEGGRWGSLVPVGDADALAKAIVAVLESQPEALPDVRRRAQDFAQDKAVDAYLDIMALPAEARA